MLENGAWAVPSIKDDKGNNIKANFAPEILIKFIAHELKTHIIVFDLQLGRVQFLSGNHVRIANVVFDSPLLIYATGGHFQSILQEDHKYFEIYAKQLEAENQDSEGGFSTMTMNTDSRQSSQQIPEQGKSQTEENGIGPGKAVVEREQPCSGVEMGAGGTPDEEIGIFVYFDGKTNILSNDKYIWVRSGRKKSSLCENKYACTNCSAIKTARRVKREGYGGGRLKSLWKVKYINHHSC